MSAQAFGGFPETTIGFLTELANNNNRDWFNDNKPRYEATVLAPAMDFIHAMAEPLSRISTHYTALPKRGGGSLMRVYRDVRFSRDKRPYKTNIGIQFRHEAGADVHAPGFYVHVAPREVFVGVGAWHPDPSALARIRSRIAERPDEWQRARDARAFRRCFALGGDSLKRPPRGFDAAHPFIEDLQRKDFLGMRSLDELAACDPDFFADTVQSFRAAAPFMAFLCAALDLPF